MCPDNKCPSHREVQLATVLQPPALNLDISSNHQKVTDGCKTVARCCISLCDWGITNICNGTMAKAEANEAQMYDSHQSATNYKTACY